MRGAEYGHVQALTILKDARADASLRDVEGKGLKSCMFWRQKTTQL